MRRNVTPLFALALLLILNAAPTRSQQQQEEKQERVISVVPVDGFLTTGGVVNVVEGAVTGRAGSADAKPLAVKEMLEDGHTVRVGPGGGRAELLLIPGYYLRLWGGAEVSLPDLSRDNLKVKILKGSVIIEALTTDAWQLNPWLPSDAPQLIYPTITVLTSQGDFAITKGGVYRFDVGDQLSELRVRKGMAFVAGRKVEDGERAELSDGTVALTKFDRKAAGDAFDEWSRARAARLVESNKSLRNTSWHKQLRSNRRSAFEIKDEERAGAVKEQYTVSAAGGFVNFVESDVSARGEKSEWRALEAGAHLEPGERVRTGEGSRAEIIIYPSCYLHLSGNTEVVYRGDVSERVSVIILRGSAIVRSAPEGEGHPPVTVVVPGVDEYSVARKGVYRFNALPEGGGAEALVYKGKLLIGGREVGEGRRIVSLRSGREVMRMSKTSLDAFDVWSEGRHVSLPRYEAWIARRLKVNRAEYGGLWFFDDVAGAYTFVPGVFDYSSPYGGKYKVKFRATGSRPAGWFPGRF